MNIIKNGKYRGEKILYKDGIGCVIWIPFSQDDDSTGLCFDFPFEDIDEIIGLLEKVKIERAEPYDDVES